MTLTYEEVKRIDEKMAVKVGERKNRLRKSSIQGALPEEIVSDMLVGMRLTVTNIDFVRNLVTLRLTE